MQALFLVLHVLVGIGLITLILLQHGKGADAGAAFGSGASATVFGARGSATFLTKATAILALLFFSNSFFLNYLSANTAGPKSVIEEQKESKLPTGIIESTVTPIEKEAGKEAGEGAESPPVAPESDLPALPGEPGGGTAGSDVPPVSPGSQASDLPSPDLPSPEGPAPGTSLSEPQGAAPIAKTPAPDKPKDLPSPGERPPEAAPKPPEGAADQGPPPAEPGPAAAPAKPQATAPSAPAKKTQAVTEKAAAKRAPAPKTAHKQQPPSRKSTSSSTTEKKENKTP